MIYLQFKFNLLLKSESEPDAIDYRGIIGRGFLIVQNVVQGLEAYSVTPANADVYPQANKERTNEIGILGDLTGNIIYK